MRYTLLEPLRGLAALWVFCFHYQFSEAFQAAFPRLHAFLKIGDLGVPMFFVLSGYCITASARSSLRHSEPTSHFLYRRVRRIYPPYWCSVLVVVAIPFLIELLSALKSGRYVPPSAEYHGYGFLKYGPMDWFLVLSLLQAFQDVPGATALQEKFNTINSVYWTLAIEVQFYLVVALALAARRHLYLALAVSTLASVPFSLSPVSYNTGLFLPYWPMFAVGIALYGLFEQGYSPSQVFFRHSMMWPIVLVLVSLIGFCAYFWCGLPMTQFGFALFFAWCLYWAEPLDRTFQSALASKTWSIRAVPMLLMAMGAMSYSLYLLHSRLQFLVMQGLRQAVPPNGITFDLCLIATTCGLCYFFYLVCERPFMSVRLRDLSGAGSCREPIPTPESAAQPSTA